MAVFELTMPGDDRFRFLERSMKAFQRNVGRTGPAVSASYTLIGAIILFGGLGYVLDGTFGTSPAWLVGGLLLGIVAGMYQLARTMWRR